MHLFNFFIYRPTIKDGSKIEMLISRDTDNTLVNEYNFLIQDNQTILCGGAWFVG